MFRWLGTLVARAWFVLLLVWAIGLTVGWLFAPTWEQVTQVGEVRSLPQTAPSVEADQAFREAFPLEYSPSSVVLVFARAEGPLQEKDKQFIEREVAPGVGAIAAADPENIITSVRTLAERRAGALLVSPDKQATLVLVELSTALSDPRNQSVVGDLEKLVDRLRADNKIPDGLDAAVTGSATAGRDLTRAEIESMRAIEAWTVIVVIGLLLLLYRAPLVALIPLGTVFLAVVTAMPILTSLAGAGVLTLFSDLRIFITVLAYGAGVDYCLFLIARYREELDTGAAPADAIARAITQVGGAVTASAATVIGGIAMLAFGDFPKIHAAGIVIPLALAVVLLATLTVSTSLLRLAGRWAFWPHFLRRQSTPQSKPTSLQRILGGTLFGNFWERAAAFLIRNPAEVWLGAVAVMTPFVVLALRHSSDTNFNPLSDLPRDVPSVLGTEALAGHFPPGVLGTAVILVRDDEVDFSSDEGVKRIAALTDRLVENKDRLGIWDVRSIARPLGTTAAAEERLAQIRASKNDVQAVVREEATPYYVSQSDGGGHTTRVEITLQVNPLTREGIDSLVRLENELPALAPEEGQQSQLLLAGATASLRDLSTVKAHDERLVQLLVPAVVFFLLLILLRRLVVSVYLILSVLFSYFATLGATYLLFRWIEGADFVGLDWKVPIFLFTILVAVGEDYNIFLLSRVKEEQKRHGPLGAIPIAMARTGRVVSSCGFIMAGTFAALLSGSLRAMQELGFALALGVLVDTLIVRPLLVPAFLVLIQRLFRGPMGRYMALGKREPDVKAAA